MRSSQITIKDLAKELKISASTVSRALKNHPSISEKTKKDVMELAKKLKYKPNTIALSLRSSRSKTLGVIIPEIVHHFFSSVISGIDDVAFKAGYHIMICQSNDNYLREVRGAETLLAARVDGILCSLAKETRKHDHFKNLQDNGIPIVFFDRICKSLETDRVIVDDKKGAFLATEHLILNGCKRIAHYSAPQNLAIGRDRFIGYLEALEKYGIPYEKELVVQCDQHDQALIVTHSMLSMKNPPDGIFAVNDATAAGAMISIKNKGLSIPKDVAVIGFSDGIISKIIEPNLSSIEQHGYEMGCKAAEVLINRLEGIIENYAPQTYQINTELIVRASSLKNDVK